jgi:hypothetical protein
MTHHKPYHSHQDRVRGCGVMLFFAGGTVCAFAAGFVLAWWLT